MSFLEEISKLTEAAPSIDPELIGFADQSAFISAKSTARPYHILDDADVGEPISRKDIYGTEEESVDSDAAEILAKGLDEQIEEADSEEDEGSDVEEDSDVESGEEMGSGEEDGYHTGDSQVGSAGEDGEEVEEKSDVKLVQQRDAQSEELKKESVKFQANTWDKLVQLRLKLQPCLQELAKIPPPEKRHKYMSGDVAQGHRNKIIGSVQLSLDKLFDLQQQMTDMNSDVRAVFSGKKPHDDDEIPSDTDEENDEEEKEEVVTKKRKRKQDSDYYWTLVKDQAEKLETYKTETLMHWYEQTKVAVKKSAFMNKEVTVLDQINHILSNKERLHSRTLQNRTSAKLFGETETLDTHPYVFNDDDFYQQLLREIIDKKMGNIDKGDPDAMGKQWVELQKLKVKAKKKSVDTKASKGRKLRYEVHSKLLGFMAPVSLDTLSDDRQNELFKSLFKSNS